MFAQLSSDNKTTWCLVLEKAWAKMKGNYMQADLGGYFDDGITSLTGMPVFYYSTNQTLNMIYFPLLTAY